LGGKIVECKVDWEIRCLLWIRVRKEVREIKRKESESMILLCFNYTLNSNITSLYKLEMELNMDESINNDDDEKTLNDLEKIERIDSD
jgi:hypothetical protein